MKKSSKMYKHFINILKDKLSETHIFLKFIFQILLNKLREKKHVARLYDDAPSTEKTINLVLFFTICKKIFIQ